MRKNLRYRSREIVEFLENSLPNLAIPDKAGERQTYPVQGMGPNADRFRALVFFSRPTRRTRYFPTSIEAGRSLRHAPPREPAAAPPRHPHTSTISLSSGQGITRARTSTLPRERPVAALLRRHGEPCSVAGCQRSQDQVPSVRHRQPRRVVGASGARGGACGQGQAGGEGG